MIDCNGCCLNKLYESDDERLRCLHRQTCERACQQGRADAIDECIELIKRAKFNAYITLANSDNEKYDFAYAQVGNILDGLAEQLKEQNK